MGQHKEKDQVGKGSLQVRKTWSKENWAPESRPGRGRLTHEYWSDCCMEVTCQSWKKDQASTVKIPYLTALVNTSHSPMQFSSDLTAAVVYHQPSVHHTYISCCKLINWHSSLNRAPEPLVSLNLLWEQTMSGCRPLKTKVRPWKPGADRGKWQGKGHQEAQVGGPVGLGGTTSWALQLCQEHFPFKFLIVAARKAVPLL